jgi:hypothetical protein
MTTFLLSFLNNYNNLWVEQCNGCVRTYEQYNVELEDKKEGVEKMGLLNDRIEGYSYFMFA